MNKARAKKFREELEKLLDIALEWYNDCTVCDETLENARRDVNSVFDTVCKRYGVTDPPIIPRTRFSDDNFIVVDFINKDLN